MSQPIRLPVDFASVPPLRGDGPSQGGADGAPAPADWRGEAERLRSALEDVVTLAHASGEARQRVVQMQRRAVAALTGTDREPTRG